MSILIESIDRLKLHSAKYDNPLPLKMYHLASSFNKLEQMLQSIMTHDFDLRVYFSPQRDKNAKTQFATDRQILLFSTIF